MKKEWFGYLKTWVNSKTVRAKTKTEAYKLLKNEAFMIAKESYQEQLLQEIVASKPGEKELREELKRKYDCVDKVAYELSVLYQLEETEE